MPLAIRIFLAKLSQSKNSYTKFGCFRNIVYLCNMKKEFGKWLMDVAKYMVTALLLSTIFTDMDDPVIIYVVVVLSIVVLGFGLYWVNEGEMENKKNN